MGIVRRNLAAFPSLKEILSFYHSYKVSKPCCFLGTLFIIKIQELCSKKNNFPSLPASFPNKHETGGDQECIWEHIEICWDKRSRRNERYARANN